MLLVLLQLVPYSFSQIVLGPDPRQPDPSAFYRSQDQLNKAVARGIPINFNSVIHNVKSSPVAAKLELWDRTPSSRQRRQRTWPREFSYDAYDGGRGGWYEDDRYDGYGPPRRPPRPRPRRPPPSRQRYGRPDDWDSYGRNPPGGGSQFAGDGEGTRGDNLKVGSDGKGTITSDAGGLLSDLKNLSEGKKETKGEGTKKDEKKEETKKETSEEKKPDVKKDNEGRNVASEGIPLEDVKDTGQTRAPNHEKHKTKKKKKSKKTKKKKNDEDEEDEEEDDDENGELEEVDGEVKAPKTVDGETNGSDEDEEDDENEGKRHSKKKGKNKKKKKQKDEDDEEEEDEENDEECPLQTTTMPTTKADDDDEMGIECEEEEEPKPKKKSKKNIKKKPKCSMKKKPKCGSQQEKTENKIHEGQLERHGRSDPEDGNAILNATETVDLKEADLSVPGINCLEEKDEFPTKCGAWKGAGYCKTNQATQYLWCRKTCLCAEVERRNKRETSWFFSMFN